MASVDQDLSQTVTCDVSKSSTEKSATIMDPVVTDDWSADDPVLPARLEDCGSPGSAVIGEETGRLSPKACPPLPPPPSSLTPDTPSEESEVDGTASATQSETSPPAVMEDSTVSGGAEVTAAGTINTSDSVAGTAASSGRVRRRKSSPKKREMPDDLMFPMDVIMKEESSDDEYKAAISTDTSSGIIQGEALLSGADGFLGSSILVAQNGIDSSQWASQKKSKGRRKKRSPAFQKPLLIKGSSETASLMFVIPNEEIESVVDTKKKRKRKEEVYEEVQWCEICDECFCTEDDLEEHLKTHLDQSQEDYECEDCGRVFESTSELEQHWSKKHGKLRFCCDICGIQYNYKSQFVIHMRAHSGERPFTCTDCGQEFGHKCSLVIHQRKHTGVTPHQCKKCKKMLDTRVALAKHEKMRYCHDCQKCYTHRSFSKHLIKNCVKA